MLTSQFHLYYNDAVDYHIFWLFIIIYIIYAGIDCRYKNILAQRKHADFIKRDWRGGKEGLRGLRGV